MISFTRFFRSLKYSYEALVQSKTHGQKENAVSPRYLGGECDFKKFLVISTQADQETHCQAHADSLRACSNGSLIYSYMNVSLQINIACFWFDDAKVKVSVFSYECLVKWAFLSVHIYQLFVILHFSLSACIQCSAEANPSYIYHTDAFIHTFVSVNVGVKENIGGYIFVLFPFM